MNTVLVLVGTGLLHVAASVDPDHIFDHGLLEIYSQHNLPFRCLPYIRKAPIGACDCIACQEAEPQFKEKMCKLYEDVKQKGKQNLVSPHLVGTCSFQATCPNVPVKCCNPQDPQEKKAANGCSLCRPAAKSTPTSDGLHASCFLAEYDSVRNSTGWFAFNEAVNEAVKQAKLHHKCISYPLHQNAKICDCEDCLQNETQIRDKMCAIAAKVRANSKLQKPTYWAHNDFYIKFCDKTACPTIPNKCCSAAATGESLETDRKGCPQCIPVSASFGFGPRCRTQFTTMPAALKEKVFAMP